MDRDFGQSVQRKAGELQQAGKDANQSAKILFDQDPQGYNYGIGIILDGKGTPAESSATLARYLKAELETCSSGSYMNSAKLMGDLKQAVLRWQRIPEEYWDFFSLALPSDAGTGAVKSAVELQLMLNPHLRTLGIESLGWPAYKAIAKVARVAIKEFPQDGVAEGEGILPLYQSGPMNTTGMVRNVAVNHARAEKAAADGVPVVLDRAYSGFEFTRLSANESCDQIMRQSFQLQLLPFLEAGVPMSIAISPTKAFITFAYRPCGLLLVYSPQGSPNVVTALNTTIRARGSSFEHPVTRAFAKAMVNDVQQLEQEHARAMKRLYDAESLWASLVAGTAMESLFSDQYAGLFRNPRAKENAPVHIYGSHLYPVFSQGRCRLNVTGLPLDAELAKRHVAVFSEFCYE